MFGHVVQHGTAPLVVTAPIAVPDIYLIDPTTYNRRNDDPEPVEDDVDPLDAFMNGVIKMWVLLTCFLFLIVMALVRRY